jgi:hypothetical protein
MELEQHLHRLREMLEWFDDPRMLHVIQNGVHGTGARVAIGGLALPGFTGSAVVSCSQSDEFRITPASTLRYKSRPIWFEASAQWRIDDAWEIHLVTVRRSIDSREVPHTAQVRGDLIAALNASLPTWAALHEAELTHVRDAQLRSQIQNIMWALNTALMSVNNGFDKVTTAVAELNTPVEQRQLYRRLRDNGVPPFGAVDACAALE